MQPSRPRVYIGSMSLPNHACPRCGYDFTGVIESWKDSCPVQGVCTECGLEFLCGDVLNPSRMAMRWSFEHAEAKRVRALAKTLALTLRPGRFWSAMRMEYQSRLLRLVLLVLAAMSLCQVTFMLFACAAQVPGIDLEAIWNEILLGSVPDVEWKNLLWLNSIGGEMYDRSTGEVLPPVTTWWLLLSGALIPLCFVMLPTTLRKRKVRPRHLARIWAYAIPVGILTISIPWIVDDALTAFIKWQWNHQVLFINAGPILRFWLDNQWRVLVAVWLAWQVWWWRAACTRYLRLPHGTGIAMSLVVLSLLLGMIPFFIVPALGFPWLQQLFH